MLNQEYYNLRNLRLLIEIEGVSGARGSGITEFAIKRNPVYAQKWPGQSFAPSQALNGENYPDASITAYSDADLNFKNLLPNASITGFTLLSPNDGDEDYLSDLLAYFPLDGWTVGGAGTNLNGGDNSTINFPIMFNVLNPGVGGDYPA